MTFKSTTVRTTHRGVSPGRVLLVLSTLLIGAAPSAAQEVRVGRHVVIRSDEVIADDLYAFGDTVVIEGTVKGDVMASGRVVRVLGTVEGDLIGCGQTYVVDGRIGDDLRIAGMTVVLGRHARVGDDVATAAGALDTRVGSSIAGSLLFVGYRGRLAGNVVGDVGADAVEVELNGSVGGEVDIAVEHATEPTWHVGGARQAATVLIVGLLVAWIAPATLRNLESALRGRALLGVRSGAIGIAAVFAQGLVVSVVAIGLGFAAWLLQLWPLLFPAVSLVVFAEGVVLAGCWMLAVFVGPVTVSTLIGRSILHRLTPARAGGIVLPLVVGLSLLAVLVNIPYVGVLVQLVVVLLGVGALWSWSFEATPSLT